MFKKNKQGAWQRRYCCLVPHTFLYYFESKDAEVGRTPSAPFRVQPRPYSSEWGFTQIGLNKAVALYKAGGGVEGVFKVVLHIECFCCPANALVGDTPAVRTSCLL